MVARLSSLASVSPKAGFGAAATRGNPEDSGPIAQTVQSLVPCSHFSRESTLARGLGQNGEKNRQTLPNDGFQADVL